MILLVPHVSVNQSATTSIIASRLLPLIKGLSPPRNVLPIFLIIRCFLSMPRRSMNHSPAIGVSQRKFQSVGSKIVIIYPYTSLAGIVTAVCACIVSLPVRANDYLAMTHPLKPLSGFGLTRANRQSDDKGNDCQGQHAGKPYSGKPEQAAGKAVFGHQWYPSSGLTLPRNTQ